MSGNVSNTPYDYSVWNNRLSNEEFNSNFGNPWNQGVSNQDVISSWLFPEQSANNAAIRERNAWLEQAQYNSPAAQMARMKAAGINPNTAAAGVAGVGNAPAASPVAQSQPQNPFEPIGKAAELISGIGQGIQGIASAVDTMETLSHDIDLIDSQYKYNLAGIGLVKGQQDALTIENKYRGENLMLDIAQKRLQLPILRQSFKNLKAQYDVEIAQANKLKQDVIESQGRVDLMTWQELEMKANAAKAQAEANFINGKFQLLDKLHWDTSTGFGGLAAGLALSDMEDGKLDFTFDGILEATDRYNGAVRASEFRQHKLLQEKQNRFEEHLMKLGITADQKKLIMDLLKQEILSLFNFPLKR